MDSGKRIGSKLALLAKSKSIKQTELATKCEASRVSLNRFFRGQSELRLTEFLKLMLELGIDIESIVDMKIQLSADGIVSECNNCHQVVPAMTALMEMMDSGSRRTQLSNLLSVAQWMQAPPSIHRHLRQYMDSDG